MIPCMVNACREKKSKSKIATHVLPQEKDLLLLWLSHAGRDDLIEKLKHNFDFFKFRRQYRMCDIHFSADCKFPANPRNKKKLKSQSVPTLHLPNEINLMQLREKLLEMKKLAKEIFKDDYIPYNYELPCLKNISTTNTEMEERDFPENTLIRLGVDQDEVNLEVSRLKLINDVSENERVEKSTVSPELETKLCRSCLENGEEMETIASLKHLPNFGELLKFLKLDPLPDNELSTKHICNNCISQLYNILYFKQQCENSYEILKEMSSEILPPNENDLDNQIEDKPYDDRLDDVVEDKRLHCLHCTKDFSSRKWRACHEILSHGILESLRQCKQCKFQYAVNMQVHVTENHANVCYRRGCGRTFTNVFLLAKHLLQKEMVRHECQNCFKMLDSWEAFQRHTEEHQMVPKKCICKICKRTVFNVHQHMKRHETDLVKCELCGQQFFGVQNLSNHEYTYHETELCPYCGLMIRKPRFHYHKMIHLSPTTKLTCRYCEKKFTTSRSRYLHEQLLHLQKRSHRCSGCAKTFIRASNLKRHFQKEHFN